MKLHILNKIAICAVLNMLFITSAYSDPITQTTAPASVFNDGWPWVTLGSVDLAQGTNALYALTSSAIVNDQGWGGYDSVSNGVWIGLFVNNVDIYNEKVADMYRGNYTPQTYDISNDAQSFADFNSSLSAISWGAGTTARITMFSALQAYPGWSMTVNDASFSVTTEAVPEPASIALLATGLIGFAASRRKKNHA